MITRSICSVVLAALTLLSLSHPSLAADAPTRYITTTNSDGETTYLEDNRKPSLYTGNFGDCMGSSTVNVTRFDAAYYKDNMTVLFHLQGNTAVANTALMLYIGVFAYGESRFDLVFDPCNANIESLCPMNASVPIEASGIIPVNQQDVANIPSIALSIPDFEGEAILRIFSNVSQSEIGCFSAVVTNGATFSQPQSVGTVIGVFAFVAMLASFATAVYGDNISVMRKHYAHSLSVLVVFAVYQHIFFTGLLSMNWPSVLVAWWSNFAWAGGMIYSSSMQNSINHLIGNNLGNTSQVGAAGSGTSQEGVGGGYDASLIYKRALNLKPSGGIAADIFHRDHSQFLKRDVFARDFERGLQRRAIANSSSGYGWYGKPIGEGLPLPGNYSGFAGTLAEEGIRISNAFMTGFLWFLIILVLVIAAVVAVKWVLEGLVLIKLLKRDRLSFFREHWKGYAVLAALRTLFIGFSMMMLLTMFQFSYDSSGGVKAIAAIIFLIFFIGIPGAVIYACYYRGVQTGVITKPEFSDGPAESESQKTNLLTKFGIKKMPAKITVRSLKRQSSHSEEEYPSIHDDEDYVQRFGWLSGRFRRTRWWFFTAWVLYEFLRACFYSGASGHPETQVFGLLVVECLAFAGLVWARPFEGQRLNVLVVYLLGFSKVATVALSSVFVTSFNLARIPATVIGVVIIVIQGILTIVTMIAVVVSAISSYLSLVRNREEFRPKQWMGMREKYLNHLDRAATDLPPPPPPIPEEPKGPYFSVASVKRVAKIEDEDPDFVAEMAFEEPEPSKSYVAVSQRSATPGLENLDRAEGSSAPLRRARAASRASRASVHSMSYTNLPYGARVHRPSWSTRDFSEWNAEQAASAPTPFPAFAPDDEIADGTPARSGASTPVRSGIATPSQRGPLRSATTPASMLRPMGSMDSLHIGGEVSTPDTIGDVPPPTVKPRAGTFNGRAGSGSRSNTPTPRDRKRSITPSSRLELSTINRPPLTPTEERDELYREMTREEPAK
ncbi:hypothetical protein AAFC00_003752 [Neodothiora populina]|uniref:ML-like domain-containing protein n=1 Tax=Neodothiora populina TaxID=2781224 RepID=A0ABR3PGH4_9PEZI